MVWEAMVCEATEPAAAVLALPRCRAGERASNATATTASTGTTQTARTHPREVTGLDKTILLNKIMLTTTTNDNGTLMISLNPWLETKRSAGGQDDSSLDD